MYSTEYININLLKRNFWRRSEQEEEEEEEEEEAEEEEEDVGQSVGQSVAGGGGRGGGAIQKPGSFPERIFLRNREK